MTDCENTKRALLAVEIPRDELALRIMAQCIQMIPPPGANATATLDSLQLQGLDAEPFRCAADAAVLYMRECINRGVQPS